MASDDEFFFYDDCEEEGVEEGMMEVEVEGLVDDAAEQSSESRADCRVQAITKESLSAEQHKDLSVVMNLVNIKRHNARALLIHHQWKIQRIHDHFDRKGRDGLLMEAGIVLHENSSIAAAGLMTPSRSITCNVCFEDFSPSVVSSMDCGHYFCNDCWTEYFSASLDSGGKQIRCMEVKCSTICDEDMMQRLLTRKYPDAAARLYRFLLESYLENNDYARWCPSVPNCGRAIRVKPDERHSEVACPCGAPAFCFNCAEEPHSPCPCAMWKKWDANGESANLKWILHYTKSCPSCLQPIEKNGGCNHVICRCGQHICYSCGGVKFDVGHSCNRYKEGDERKSMDAGQRQLQRYTHYSNRFNTHLGSYKLEKKKLGPAVKACVRRLGSDLDARWLTGAHHRLLSSRQVLSRSYAFAYFMFGGHDQVKTHQSQRANLAVAQNRFEDQQEQLEHNVECLSKVLATEEPEKEEVINLDKIVQGICGKMYRCIQDELLPLLEEPMSIAAYRPDGPCVAEE